MAARGTENKVRRRRCGMLYEKAISRSFENDRDHHLIVQLLCRVKERVTFIQISFSSVDFVARCRKTYYTSMQITQTESESVESESALDRRGELH